MNGADALCETLLANDVNVCFANPGTSEMHFVAALDRQPAMRCILGLFEGVVSGAADGYGRMTGKPAATLMHTGPGLANGLANLHNARRAGAPIVNIVGDHASFHLQFDPPLASDIESLARPVSRWVGRASGSADIAPMAEKAVLAAHATSSVATLILPADAAWGGVEPAASHAVVIPPRPQVPPERIRAIATALRLHCGRFGVVVAGDAAVNPGLEIAAGIALALGGEVFSEVIPGRVARGRGTHPVRRIPYFIDQATASLAGFDLLVLIGAPEPVAFFAYPGKPSRLVQPRTEVLTLATRDEDILQALAALAEHIEAPKRSALRSDPIALELPTGALTDDAISIVLAQLMPENAILCDEGITSSRRLFELAARGSPHDYLMTAGGAIGNGIPMALGAAIACPDRKIINLQADGSGMYTLQGLWTMARESADVLIVIFANRRYAILEIEMANLGVNEIGRNAGAMMSLGNPDLDWVMLARGMGVEAARTDTCERFADLVGSSLRRRGPFLIECVI
ncbi:MAG: acetolactate synthase large subunit [Devosia sp.]